MTKKSKKTKSRKSGLQTSARKQKRISKQNTAEVGGTGVANGSSSVTNRERNAWSKLGAGQIGAVPYFFFFICVIAQLATIAISWPTWELRPVVEGTIPNLPWVENTPQFSTGILLAVSLVFALLSPKKYGLIIHLVILAISISMDQFRCQPQILSIAFMMSACVWPLARRLCLWYLVAMWTWAGIHKLLSPDWMNQVSYYMLGKFEIGLHDYGLPCPANISGFYRVFAIVVALTEIGTGLLAWIRPKFAAVLCVALHLGILGFLLPMNWNQSVIPWNLATAIVGSWLLWNACQPFRRNNSDPVENESADFGFSSLKRLALPKVLWERVVVILLLTIPIGFYFGLVRHCFAHSLYSNNLPLGMITRIDRMEFLESWDQLRMPFPNVQKAYRDYFKLTGKLNDKLHIRETKTWLQSHYYLHTGNRNIREISAESFLDPIVVDPMGMGIDDPRVVFELTYINSVVMKRRNEKDMVYAVEFNADRFEPKLLRSLVGLPNLQQINLSGCNVSDEDLDLLSDSNRLLGIWLTDTQVTKEGLIKLKKFPNLRQVEYDGQTIPGNEIDDWIDKHCP